MHENEAYHKILELRPSCLRTSSIEIDIKHEFKEYVCLKINLLNNDKLLIGCFYKSPSSSEEQHKALNDLLMKISKLDDSYSHVLLTGDFNFPDINWETWSAKDSFSTNFLECVRDCYYQQMVDKPTRYRINQLVLVNDKNFIHNSEYQDPIGDSDHNVLGFNFKCYLTYKNSKSVKFNYFKANYDKLKAHMKVNCEE
ncbi:unnamed protein product [Mytilus coruscus]|uniref:Endonuclease/exonuclease/phosphatase domain-containing protein n=1 Tax=Mytilus coruscus TaxID=42192 RepID=A0A6J8CHN1_MYTCO|nr:unnamed protein product [Mytilus coruscus]